ncbi:dicarboxylate/amino acid:cation symporter [Saccharophagus degradans]|uniref:dicarboxylate/amino acid:cation symporter n=1 Tax=Saccharophagus degradans TaxID=86304 RepID=UPI001C0928FD|nr:dicarboxylate/amino acid:cation symporter [Saccharophagus degradans]MBU2987088.1 dicarboxylate/amino acid:cation symporter [Saccharophagus degradans]
MLKLKLHWQILIAIAAAFLVGGVVNFAGDAAWAKAIVNAGEFIGTFFLNALKMIIVPLVLSSIICGVAGMGKGADLGRLGAKALSFYALSSTIAILVGLLVVNVMTPGEINGEPARDQLNLSSTEQVDQQLAKVEGRGLGDVAAVFLRMVPPNLVEAAAEGQMLGLITFGLLFGFFMVRVAPAASETLVNFWTGVSEVMMKITMLVMKFAPLGVFGLVTVTIAGTGLEILANLAVFFFTVTFALAIHVLVVMPLLLRYLGGVKNPYRQIAFMAPALLTAFSTASSSGTLPLTMDCVEKNAGVSKRTSSFVLPLGATINMDGTALYECVAAMFIAQAYGLDLTIGVQFTIVLIALLTSIGVAGIPSASLVAITVILTAVGLPLEGIGLLLVTDRILDMMRTAVNVFSDSCCATIIARTEGEKTNFE